MNRHTSPIQPIASQALVEKSVAVQKHSAVLCAPVRRIVTFHPGELSSFLWTLPALQALREGFPGARLCVVARPTLAPFLHDSPLCDEVWQREKGGLSRQTALMLQLRTFNPDIAFCFSRSRLSTLLAWSSGAEERVGFAGARLENLLTQRIECDEIGTPESFNFLATAAGCTPKQTHARDLLSIPVEAEKSAARVLEEHAIDGDFLVAMCDAASTEKPLEIKRLEKASDDDSRHEIEYSKPRTGILEQLEQPVRAAERAAERAWQAGTRAMQTRVAWPIGGESSEKNAVSKAASKAASDSASDEPESKPMLRSRRDIAQWPAAHWTSALRELSGRAPVVLVGASPAPNITSRLESRVLDLGGQLEPIVIAAILRRARLFIGSDSGVLHLAAAVGTPVVGIYGPTDWRRSGPRGVPHRIVKNGVECEPCELQKCLWTGEDERKCLTHLAPENVVEAARELIGL